MEQYYAVIAWFFCAFLFLLGELQSPGLFFMLSGVGGSCIGALLAWSRFGVTAQLVGCCLGIIVTWYLLRYYVDRIDRMKATKTNVDALIGRTGYVIRACSAQERGLVRIGGEIWSAYTYGEDICDAEVLVEVCAVRGCHLMVKTK